jgi:hypothetical protein
MYMEVSYFIIYNRIYSIELLIQTRYYLYFSYVLTNLLTNNVHGAESCLRSEQLLSHSRISPHYKKLKAHYSVHKRQLLVPILSQANPVYKFDPVSLISILILLFHLHLDLLSGSFLQVFRTNEVFLKKGKSCLGKRTNFSRLRVKWSDDLTHVAKHIPKFCWCMYVCMYVSTYVCMYVCMYVFM